MKKGSYLVNSSSGKTLDLDAVISALKSQHLAGAAIDSFPEGDSPKNLSFLAKFVGVPNLIVSPHISKKQGKRKKREKKKK